MAMQEHSKSHDAMEIDDEIKTVSLVTSIAEYTFKECIETIVNQEGAHSLSDPGYNYQWTNIAKQIDKEASEVVPSNFWSNVGLLGPLYVQFDAKRSSGNIKFNNNPVQICSNDNFATAFGNTCVLKGKWQYEVLLGSKGVMQIGWGTLNCKFSQEKGVGDTIDSYSYDGNRQRKWNISTLKYGDIWEEGDIISCLIDMDLGCISYLRNGRPLGIAFRDIKIGNIAYFPAISLALGENVIVNFGASPYLYPQEGYQPFVKPQIHGTVVAATCLRWLTRLAKLKVIWSESPHWLNLEKQSGESGECSLLVVCHHIGSTLSFLLTIPFITEAALIPHLASMAESVFSEKKVDPQKLKYALAFIDYLACIMQYGEMKAMTSNLIQCIVNYMKIVSCDLKNSSHIRCLKILRLLLSHVELRNFVMKYVIFEDNRFCSFSCNKIVDKAHLKHSINIDFFSNKNGSFSVGDRQNYLRAVDLFHQSVCELEDLQEEIFRLLMTREQDCSYNETSRALFLTKFRIFLKEQFFDKGSLIANVLVSHNMILSLFHRCFSLFASLWISEVGALRTDILKANLFYDGRLPYFDIYRLGGLDAYLRKIYVKDLQVAQDKISSLKVDMQAIHLETDQSIESSRSIFDSLVMTPKPSSSVDEHEKKGEAERSLLEFLDGIIILYHHAGHKYMEKMIAESNSFYENVSHYQKLLTKKQKIIHNDSLAILKDEIDFSINVCERKINEESYSHAWSLASHFSVPSISKIILLLGLIRGGLQNASNEGNLLGFVPEFYVDILSEIVLDLKSLIISKEDTDNATTRQSLASEVVRPGGFQVPKTMFDNYVTVLNDLGSFLGEHYGDTRIVYTDSKSSILQSLAGFVCHKIPLRALESSPLSSRLKLIRNLLEPYENRPWAQNNWILVQLWKGKGFGFHYSTSPHLINKLQPKPAYCEIPNLIQTSEPCPSDLFLSMISEAFEDQEISNPFVNSLLNQLNWVFSEFIGMIQEIQNASNRPERVFIESRQLRICATCFDLTLALLRVLEMTVCVAPNLFLDENLTNSQSLLSRLCQLLCQVLNRINIASGCFSLIVNLDIPGLETVHYFPILTAVIGILCKLCSFDIYTNKDSTSLKTATNALLKEASFQISTLKNLLCGLERKTLVNSGSSQELPSSSSAICKSVSPYPEEPNELNCKDIAGFFKNEICECKHPKFCLRKCGDGVKPWELRKAADVILHLESALILLDERLDKAEDSDLLCTICYASQNDAKFQPCGHTSCTSCVTHHLMNKKVCFFCQSVIDKVVSMETNVDIIIVEKQENSDIEDM